jgi:hypothetical protein
MESTSEVCILKGKEFIWFLINCAVEAFIMRVKESGLDVYFVFGL